MENSIELKSQIEEANKAYRLGRPIMSDIDFDNLCEEYERMVSPEEYADFRDSLHEETGRVQHPYIMGSLDKLKIEEPENIVKWLSDYVRSKVNVSAKIDGISCRIHYDANGNFVSATTRGNGYFGIDISDKVSHVKNVPATINIDKPVDIRGELVILNDDFVPLASILKNPRNACAGIINQKDVDVNLLSHVSFVAYEIMGGTYSKSQQFDMLESLGFVTSKHDSFDKNDSKLLNTFEQWIRADFGYPTDGIVVSDDDYHAELDAYRPKAQRAIKISAIESTSSVLIDVDWSQPSKNGRITPVGIIEPIALYGATIRRVTLNNLDWIEAMQLKIGSHVNVTRSNGVIPKIISVHNDGSEHDIEIPTTCPICGSPTTVSGADLCCTNLDCGASRYLQIRTFLQNLGIKHVSTQTISNLDISTIDDLIAFKADKNYKVQTRFESDIYHAIFGNDELVIFKALPFKNIAEKTLDKIIDFYGFDYLKKHAGESNFWTKDFNAYPKDVAERTMVLFNERAKQNFEALAKIMGDARWHGNSYVKSNKVITTENTQSVCFTGKLNTMSRKEAQKLAIEHGFKTLDSVSKELTYLVTNSSEMSSKMKNAIKFGIKIISEDEFLAMCK